ncbi:MAG: hypothetical protein M1481_06735 [Candidatus Thermoplasmatota archaeon]|nr:hypothetical protein [Candidatus Thermoplasmatota archaeon]MCL5963975.1 hypothetical protein [Candidatus Thermoplasmatota archaeon]
MKSYLLVNFSSDGAKPSDVANRLALVGFKPTHGNYDFIYDWDHEPSTDEAIVLADKIHNIMRGFDILYKMETI